MFSGTFYVRGWITTSAYEATSQCGHQHETQNYLLVWIILIEIWGTTTSETLIMKIWGRCYDIQYEQQKLP